MFQQERQHHQTCLKTRRSFMLLLLLLLWVFFYSHTYPPPPQPLLPFLFSCLVFLPLPFLPSQLMRTLPLLAHCLLLRAPQCLETLLVIQKFCTQTRACTELPRSMRI
jgi:hypothetical protein